MTVRQTVDLFVEEERRSVRTAAAASQAAWRQVDTFNIAESWKERLPGLLDVVTNEQRRAAEAGVRYSSQVIAEQATPRPAGRINAQHLAGIASDGRPLDSLFILPAYRALDRIGNGQPSAEAMAAARRQTAIIAATQIADAARVGSSLGMVSDQAVSGYRRQISPPACARCAIQAGKWFRWNQGFQRHPACQCVHVPAVGPKADAAGLESFDPDAYFQSLSQANQDRLFTKAGAEAIRSGADMNQVVNARRGMRTAFDARYGRKVASTLEGTTARASAGRVLREQTTAFGRDVEVRPGLSRRIAARPMPEEIYRAAEGNRDTAIRALARWGYLEG